MHLRFEHTWLRAAAGILIGLGLAPAPAAVAADSASRTVRAPFVRVGRDEFRKVTAQLPPGASIAILPSQYTLSDGKVQATGHRFAMMRGDVDGDKRAELVCAAYYPPAPVMPSSFRDDRARIVVFKREKDEWVRSYTSPGLGFEFTAATHNLEEVERGLAPLDATPLPLNFVDVDRDGSREVAFYAASQDPDAGGLLPGIYRWTNARWVNLAPTGQRFGVRDLNGDGTLEVVVGSRYVGYGMGDDDVPRVYHWTGRKYEEASTQYPSFYADLARRYRTHVEGMSRRGETYPQQAWERAIQKAQSLGAERAPERGAANAPVE